MIIGIHNNIEGLNMKLIKGKTAGSPRSMQHNYEVMRDAGYKPERARGAAYGEVGMEKMARRHESEGMKRLDRQRNW